MLDEICDTELWTVLVSEEVIEEVIDFVIVDTEDEIELEELKLELILVLLLVAGKLKARQ